MEDVASFLGPSPAPEVKRALPLIAKLEQKDLRAVLPKAIQYLKGDDLKEADIAGLQLKDQGLKFLFAQACLFHPLYIFLKYFLNSRIRSCSFHRVVSDSKSGN